MSEQETRDRNRLLIYTLLRAMGLAIFFGGVAIAFTGVLRPGGWPQVGAIIAIAGVIDAFVAPRMIKRQWDREDR